MGKKILMPVGDYVEDYEAMVPFQTLQVAGHTVHAVCPGKGKGDTVHTAVHDSRGAQTYDESPGHDFRLNADFGDVDPSDYDALLIPGGRAPEYLRLDDRLLAVVRHFFEEDKPVAAVCHGVQILTAAGVVEGRTMTGYPACGPEVRAAGGDWRDTSMDAAITDGNLVTAPAWSAHVAWLGQFLELLGTRIETAAPAAV